MSDVAAVSRLGQVNASGSDDALFLKVFSGEVLERFERLNQFRDLVMMRTIDSGKSAQFPSIGNASTSYHVPGDDILSHNLGEHLSQVPKNERVITIDDLLISSVFIDSLDEARNHYDVRAPYARKVAEALATAWDQRVLRALVLAARDTTAHTTGAFVGETIQEAAFNTTSANAVAAIFDCAQKFDEKDIPDDGDRYIAVSPEAYYTLVQATDLLDRDYGNTRNGVFSDGTVMKAAGIKIVKTNNLPSTNYSAASGEGDSTTADFSDTAAVAFHREAVGIVKLRDLATEMEYQIRNQGHLMVAKFAWGCGTLRNEAAIEIDTA